MKKRVRQFTAVYKKDGKWYLGWIEEVPGVNTQGKTLKEVKANLMEALQLVLETNRMLDDIHGTDKVLKREPISISF